MTSNQMTTYICLFHEADRGRAALSELTRAGVSPDAITTIGNSGDREGDYKAGTLEQMGVPDRDLAHLREGLERGGVLVTVVASEDSSDQIERVFHKYSADKIDEADLGTADLGAAPATPAYVAPVSTTGTAMEQAVVPVVAEELVVGKREVNRGGVRVFRRVVEQPVTETVNLHEEHVVIDRRPVNRPVSEADMATAGRTIELTETQEVPVVTKTAHVVEEVRVGLQESDRTETVEDTVRHTEIDVEPVQGSTRKTQGY